MTIFYLNEENNMTDSLKTIIDQLPEDRRRRIDQRAQAIHYQVALHQLCKHIGISQKRLNDLMKKFQVSSNNCQGQNDIQFSTLCRLIQSLGGNIKITATIPGKDEFDLLQLSHTYK